MYTATTMYELGKQQMHQQRFGAADELFGQCEVMLNSVRYPIAEFRSLAVYRAQCAAHRNLRGAGLARDADQVERNLRHELAAMIPHAERNKLKQYACRLRSTGLACSATMAKLDRITLYAKLCAASVEEAHADQIVNFVLGHLPWYEQCFAILERVARAQALMKLIVPKKNEGGDKDKGGGDDDE